MAFEKILTIVIIAIIFSVVFIGHAEATYRKPPFNGSIFGKRNNNNNYDYDSNGKALSTMCEIALEACQPFFTQDKK